MLLLLLCCWSVSCQSQVPPHKQTDTLRPAQLKEDFQLFRTALEEAHPGLYAFTPKPTFDAAFDSTLALLNRPLSEQEFYKTLTPLITRVRDGHLKFMAEGKANHKYPFHDDRLLPLKLFVTEGKTHVEHTYDDGANVPAGAEVLAINGKPMAAILQELLPYVSFADGRVLSSKYLELSHHFSGYYAAFMEVTPTYAVTYQVADNTPQTVELAAVPLTLINQKEQELAATKGKEPPLQLQFLDHGVALLTIKLFWFESKETDFEQFLKDAFRQINARNTKSLILDLRNNEGGKDSYGSLLYSYLTDQPFRYYDRLTTRTDQKFSFARQAHLPWYFGIYRHLLRRNQAGEHVWTRHDNLKVQQPQPNPFRGDVYVLINGWSFSVTSEFAAVAHANRRASFIGQETGGGYYGNNSGFFAILNLPYSRFVLGIPLWHYHMAVSGYPHRDRGIIPDVPVAPSVHDLLQGVDREREVALALIRKKAPASFSVGR